MLKYFSFLLCHRTPSCTRTDTLCTYAAVFLSKGGHHGVIGIVAGRLKESFNRPAIVIGIDEFGVGKGSGRSIAGVDLGRAIMDAVLDKKLVGGGGHVLACGLTIDPEKRSEERRVGQECVG